MEVTKALSLSVMDWRCPCLLIIACHLLAAYSRGIRKESNGLSDSLPLALFRVEALVGLPLHAEKLNMLPAHGPFFHGRPKNCDF